MSMLTHEQTSPVITDFRLPVERNLHLVPPAPTKAQRFRQFVYEYRLSATYTAAVSAAVVAAHTWL